jgi:hypothetical protein
MEVKPHMDTAHAFKTGAIMRGRDLKENCIEKWEFADQTLVA